MMESSEQCAYDGSLDPDDSSSGTERIVVASYEDYAREVLPINQVDDDQAAEQVLGYLDEENATLVLQPQGIELDGKRLILAQGPQGDEIIVFVSSEQDPSVEQSLEQSGSENSIDNHTLEIACESNNLDSNEETQGIEIMESSDDLQSVDKNGTMYVEQAHEVTCIDSDNNHYSTENLNKVVYQVQEKNETTEMVFIPTTSQIISTGNNTRLLHLADVAHSEWATSEQQEKEEIDCSRNMSEGSVIVTQIRPDCISHSGKNLSIKAVSEQGDNSSSQDENMPSSSVDENPSMLSVPPRDIDNAVSVIHVTSSTLIRDQDWKTSNVQVDENRIEEVDQLDVTDSAISTNSTNLNCSDIKGSLDSELSSQSLVMEESSNHSQIKDGTDSSSKDDTVNHEISSTTVEPMDEDTNEPVGEMQIRFPCQLPSNESIDEDEPKQKDSVNCNDNNSNTSIEVDNSQNLNNKISDSSSKNCEDKVDFANSEEACPGRTFLSLKDNSESKSSFFSDNSQSSKNQNLHKLKKLKCVSPGKAKKVLDEYEFENSSNNLDQELSHNSSLDEQPSDVLNSDDVSTEVDVAPVSEVANSDIAGETGNLTFQGALSPVTDTTKLNENSVADKTNKDIYDNSQDLFVDGSCDDNEGEEINSNTTVKYFKNKQKSVSSEIATTDQDKKADERVSATNKDVSVNNKNEDNDSVVSDITTVKPPQRTYIRKRKISSSRNIELFSLELSDSKDNGSSYLSPKIFCSDNETDDVKNDQENLTDEDGYVNLMPSDVKSRISTSYKRRSSPPPVDERRTRSLRPRSSDHLENIPDQEMGAEDSVTTCWATYLMETSFKPTDTEKSKEEVPKASSSDGLKSTSSKSLPKKRVKALSDKKDSSKSDSYKSGQQWDKLWKSSPMKKNDASFDKKKIREKVKKQVKRTLQKFDSASISISVRKKGRPSKDSKKMMPEKVKTCGIRFLNDNSRDKKNSSTVSGQNTPSTSTQDLQDYQYNCSYCNFFTNKVNNLIIHMKYCSNKPPADTIDYQVNDMDRRQRIRGYSSESYSDVGKSSTSQNFSNGSIADDDDDEPDSSNPSQESLSQENGEEYEKEEDDDDDDDEDDDELKQNDAAVKTNIGYCENDVVWAKMNNRFWPALLHKIDDKQVEVFFIDRLTNKENGVMCMKFSIDSLPEQLHSFSDLEWNQKLLEEAVLLPDNDIFFKAVQKSNAFMRRKVLYDTDTLDGLTFFDIPKNIDFKENTAASSGDKRVEETLEVGDEYADVRELMDCIFKGLCNEHVIGICKGNVSSQRHAMHGHKDKKTSNRLKDMSWFGPFKSNSKMQIRLYYYFLELFRSNFKERKDIISYIYEVWIPEGIIKAISIVKCLSLEVAETIFYKQDVTSIIED